MLAKANRANSAEITLAKEKGKFIPGRFFALLVYDLKNSQPSRFAFTVSLKIHQKATRRNQVKRNLRSVVLKNLPQTKKGQIILFLAKKEILNQSPKNIQKEVQTRFRQAALLT